MKLSQLVAKELHLLNYVESTPSVSLNGVTTFEMKSGHINYRVFFVQNHDGQDMSMFEASKLAAFFNSKFFHETVNTNRLPIPCGYFERSFRIEDDNVSYLVFVIRFEKGRRRHHLSESELCQVAETIGAIHAINTATMAPEFLRVIEENYQNIRRYQTSIEPRLIGILKEALAGELSQYFSQPNKVVPRVRNFGMLRGTPLPYTVHLEIGVLQKETDELEAVLQHQDEYAVPNERVICHGRLTAENCTFKEAPNIRNVAGCQNELVDIGEWENVHFGDVALDLSNLIISSAEPCVRRNKYMTIFRRYYYSRVDHRTTNFRLSDLKRLFRKHHRHAVLLGIESLLEVLTSTANDEMKRAHSFRWESALEDAFEFTTSDYVSDDEHCLFSK